MKRAICILLSLLMLTAFVSCNGQPADESSFEEQSEEASADPTANSTKVITSLDYTNKGKMGDTDGPAFAVYSNVGYNGASVELDIANMEISTVLPDGRFVNGYCFLGTDIFEDDYWINCVDAGLCWSGKSGGWHLFYNIYETLNEETNSWYESSKKLPKNGKYRMTFTLTEDNYALLTVEGITNNFKDSVKVEVKGAKKDGSNTAFLFNAALDYPADTKVDRNGKPSEDWTEITLANSDQGLYLRKLLASDLNLYNNGNAEAWTENKTAATSIWPDKAVSGFNYAPVEVYLFDGTEYYINLDMNRE